MMAVQDYHNDQAYGEEEKQVLSFVAAQTALAIDRKRAEQALLRRTEQIRRHRNALLELALIDKSNIAAALETICARSAAASDLARVSYWSLQDDGKALVCEALYLLERRTVDPALRGTRLAMGDCPAYFTALDTREPLVANLVESHPHTRELLEGYLRPLGITSMLDVPVWLHGRLVGVLCHEHVGPPREWTAEEIDFASSVANMVSLSIEAAQRARSEQALRESEQKFRALFEASSQGVMLHDEERFLEVNPATLRIMGFTDPADIVGKHPAQMSPPRQPGGESSATVARRHIAECMEKGTARFDWVSLNAKGGEIPLEVMLTRIEMGGRRIIQAVIHDISARKQAEAELLRALAREKELSALKSSFVSMVSHEFRTPLGSS
jgi:PAS domain S-box-containing protein